MRPPQTAMPAFPPVPPRPPRAPGPQVLIVTPVRDEVQYIDALARSIAAQTRPPDLWVVVDDGSTDGTIERLREWEQQIPFMRVVIRREIAGERRERDRLATGSCIRAFHTGLRWAHGHRFDFVGKLDGDIELPPGYIGRLLEEFDRDPCLGIAGGDLSEYSRSAWRRVPMARHHVAGAVKLYRSQCLQAISPLPEALGWDTIDETYARMRGFTTRSVQDVIVRHHRPIGAHDGLLRGRARHGECAYVSHFTPTWVALRSLKLATRKPAVLSGFAFLYGYGRAAWRRTPRVADDEYRAFVHRELRRRMLGIHATSAQNARH